MRFGRWQLAHASHLAKLLKKHLNLLAQRVHSGDIVGVEPSGVGVGQVHVVGFRLVISPGDQAKLEHDDTRFPPIIPKLHRHLDHNFESLSPQLAKDILKRLTRDFDAPAGAARQVANDARIGRGFEPADKKIRRVDRCDGKN